MRSSKNNAQARLKINGNKKTMLNLPDCLLSITSTSIPKIKTVSYGRTLNCKIPNRLIPQQQQQH